MSIETFALSEGFCTRYTRNIINTILEIGGSCSEHEANEKGIQNSRTKTEREETIWKTQA